MGDELKMVVSELLTHNIREVKHFATRLDSSHNQKDPLSQYGSEGIRMYLSNMLPDWVKHHTREELIKHLRNSNFATLAERYIIIVVAVLADEVFNVQLMYT